MLMFQLKRKNADQLRPKNEHQRAHSHKDMRNVKQGSPTTPVELPFLLELYPDGTENTKGKVHRLPMHVTAVGSEPSMSTSGQDIQLFGPDVQPRHCIITHVKGIISVTPTSRDAETYVNNKLVYETTLLQHGATVEFGKNNAFRFFDREEVKYDPDVTKYLIKHNLSGPDKKLIIEY